MKLQPKPLTLNLNRENSVQPQTPEHFTSGPTPRVRQTCHGVHKLRVGVIASGNQGVGLDRAQDVEFGV